MLKPLKPGLTLLNRQTSGDNVFHPPAGYNARELTYKSRRSLVFLLLLLLIFLYSDMTTPYVEILKAASTSSSFIRTPLCAPSKPPILLSNTYGIHLNSVTVNASSQDFPMKPND